MIDPQLAAELNRLGAGIHQDEDPPLSPADEAA